MSDLEARLPRVAELAVSAGAFTPKVEMKVEGYSQPATEMKKSKNEKPNVRAR